MNIITNKKGMTLLELIIYLVIAAFLLAPVILLMHNSSLNMTRDSANVDLRITGRDILNIMYDDLKNTGFKIMINHGGMNVISSDVLVDPAHADSVQRDSSSIEPYDDGGAYDALTIYKGVLDSNGTQWQGYDIITYRAEDMQLIRERDSLMLYTDTSDVTESIVVANNVEVLQFRYSADMAVWLNGDAINHTNAGKIRFVKITIILRDDKKAGAVKNTPGDTVANFNLPNAGGPILRERFEMTVPIPNNGLIPPDPVEGVI